MYLFSNRAQPVHYDFISLLIAFIIHSLKFDLFYTYFKKTLKNIHGTNGCALERVKI